MFYLQRLTGLQVYSSILPWDFKPETPIPNEVRTDKKKRVEWINDASTKHHVYSFYEGMNQNLRVRKNRGADEGNPPIKLWGLVADFDSAQAEEFVLKIAKTLAVPPNWIERTLSGNWRYVWQFEKPASLPSYDFTLHFLKNFEKFGFPVASAMIAFDRGAWQDPARMYTNSCDWRGLNQPPISNEVVVGWLVRASQSFEWTAPEIGPVVPLDIVQRELKERYPRFSEWPGEFVLNSQGPSFWVEGSTSPMSAIVRVTGIQTFSDHAHKAFFTWSDLLGYQFVKDYEAAATGRAVEGIYFDGRQYFRKIANESWRPFERHDIALHLKTERKVSPKSDKSGVSNVDRCLAYIQSHQSVVGAAPLAMKPAGLIQVNNADFLNINTRKALNPASGQAAWGANGPFPWMSKYLDLFFEPKEQLDYFLSWLSHFYRAARHQIPRSGQNIFIAGETGVGKTLLSTVVISTLVGGSVDARDYLLGEDKFGSELFEVALWSVDDATLTAEQKTRKKFSGMIKAMAANKKFRYHAKFRIPLMVEWQGRVVVTLNRDAESILVLPELEASILDKIMLFKTAEKTIEFPEQAELQEILQRELPFFAQFLLNYEIPAHCKGESRYGVKPYHETSLVQTAQQSSLAAGFLEILEDWKEDYFSGDSKREYWEGTAYQLHKSISVQFEARDAMRAYTVNGVRRALAALMNNGEPIQCRDDKQRIWRISSPKSKSLVVATSNGVNV